MKTSQSTVGINFQAPSPHVWILLQSPSLAFPLCYPTLPIPSLMSPDITYTQVRLWFGEPKKNYSVVTGILMRNKAEGFAGKEEGKAFSHVPGEI